MAQQRALEHAEQIFGICHTALAVVIVSKSILILLVLNQLELEASH